MCRIYFDNRFGPILLLDDLPQLLAAIASITDNILRVESTTGVSRLTKDASSNTDIAQTSTRDIGSYSENRLID